jgi:lipopolysaccharide biosynthesis regulator YciM
VVEILENDPEFKRKLENASTDDIKVGKTLFDQLRISPIVCQSGNIAQHLSLVQHHVRTKLDEAKQREMNRLRDLVGQKIRNLSRKSSCQHSCSFDGHSSL